MSSNNNMHKVRGYGGVVMGFLYIIVAGLITISHKNGNLNLDLSPIVIYIFALVLVAYGGFRMYRGWKLIKQN